jgi:hypothetical protein
MSANQVGRQRFSPIGENQRLKRFRSWSGVDQRKPLISRIVKSIFTKGNEGNEAGVLTRIARINANPEWLVAREHRELKEEDFLWSLRSLWLNPPAVKAVKSRESSLIDANSTASGSGTGFPACVELHRPELCTT